MSLTRSARKEDKKKKCAALKKLSAKKVTA